MTKNPHAVALGRRGGKAGTDAQNAARRQAGRESPRSGRAPLHPADLSAEEARELGFEVFRGGVDAAGRPGRWFIWRRGGGLDRLAGPGFATRVDALNALVCQLQAVVELEASNRAQGYGVPESPLFAWARVNRPSWFER